MRSRLDELSISDPDLIGELVPKKMSLPRIKEVCSRLLEESIPLIHLKKILELLLEMPLEKLAIPEIVERLRQGLKARITDLITKKGVLNCLVIAFEIEDLLLKNLKTESGELTLDLNPDQLERVRRSLKSGLESHEQTLYPLVILTQPEIRRCIFVLLDQKYKATFVVAAQELLPHVKINPIDTVFWA